ncbi:hypothetical protein DPMN_104516 [Dreissena polymorpha]|uniref:Uncharacterized protein n=1 Tax=Dreissena polymorpha TaxID=45954 RepID=A0A9D4HDA7_DREPO|nr:hypothetical protein DPMN_104516 [Dreissena polymorpha]
MKFYESNAGFLKENLNTTHIIDPSYQLRCTAYMLRNKDNLLSANFCCQQSASFTCQSNAGFLKEVSSTSSGDTASRRILNTTHIIDPSYQLRCTAYMLRNKDKPVKCQLLLPTKRELYVSGTRNYPYKLHGELQAARHINSDALHTCLGTRINLLRVPTSAANKARALRVRDAELLIQTARGIARRARV